MRRNAKKAKILNLKIQLALLIKSKLTRVDQNFDPPHNFYWKRSYYIDDRQINIYFQNYIRRSGVNFVDISWKDDGHYRALTKTELIKLYDRVSTGDTGFSH